MLGKIEGERRRGEQRMRWLDGITYSMDPHNVLKQRVARKRRIWKTSVFIIVGNLVLGLYLLCDCFPVLRAKWQD